MEYSENHSFNLYKDIKARTNGEIYMGVVGPVRSGKSTFIKSFMDLMVLPNIRSSADRKRANDELPQSAAGRMIMTTEPKFIPKDAADINIDSVELKVRLVDCVGFMVEGAAGHLENDAERMVRTPWQSEPMPFSMAAEIGTRKVINEHSTVGIVITADGSFGDFDHSAYSSAEEITVSELKAIGKPFVMLLNTTLPSDIRTKELAQNLSDKYNCAVFPCDCRNLTTDDVTKIFGTLLNEFPLNEIHYNIPKWAYMLPDDSEVFNDILTTAKRVLRDIDTMKAAKSYRFEETPEHIDDIRTENIDYAEGLLQIRMEIDNKYYFEMLSKLSGENVTDEYELIALLTSLTRQKSQYGKVADAVSMVHINGYGVVTPTRDQINLSKPVVFHNGSRYGVRIKADATTIYMIQAGIQTEMAPIVGSEQQANDLIEYITNNSGEDNEGLWNTNIFGKTIEQVVTDGINDKIRNITEDNMNKLRETLQKVMNDNTGIVCLIV